MNSSTLGQNWQVAYEAAIFEEDRSKLPQRIAEAEKALAARATELFNTGEGQLRERAAMGNAAYFLHLLGEYLGRAPVNPQPPFLHDRISRFQAET